MLKRQVLRLLLIFICLSFAYQCSYSSAYALSAGSKIPWQGKQWFLLGVNMPWYNWGCDFGCVNNGGVSGNKNVISQQFQKLKDADVHVVRWWVFEGGAQFITRDSSGPTGINSAVYTDIDAALSLADQYDIYYVFTLFASSTDIPNGWVTSSTQRAKLVQVLTPLFAKYKNNPRVMTWDIFNEPEWQTMNNQIDTNSVVALGTQLTAAIHSNSPAYATVGHAVIQNLGMWKNAGLDYFQPHWYDPMQTSWCAICTTYQTLSQQQGTTAPVVIGEYNGASTINHLARLNDLYNRGYAGAWPWSLNPDKTSDKMTIDLQAMKTFASQHPDAGPKSSGGVQPTITTTASPVPTNTQIPTVAPTNTNNGSKLMVTLFLHGLGKGGDNVNPQSTGNLNPAHQQRQVLVSLFNAANQPAGVRQGTVTYNSSAGNFIGAVDLGTLTAGVYTVKIFVSQYLVYAIPGIVTLNANQTASLPAVALITGDTNNDNRLSILDYSALLDCFSDLSPAKNCSDANKKQVTDLTDDGSVNQFDYNLFLRELSVQSGDGGGTVPTPTAAPTSPPANNTLSIKVVGNHFVNQNNQTIQLRGINRSSTQYMCADGGAFFDGPSDTNAIAAIKAWGVNVVRVNMNEHCWLGLSDIPAGYRGAAYQNVIGDFVNRLNAQGIYAIIDMHFNAPGTNTTDELGAPDRDHATAYWSSVANYFKNNRAVLFDLYNEPTSRDTTAGWTCIRDGGCSGYPFVTEGMQQMLNAVRATGATNPVLVGGPEWAGSLSQWLTFKPNDSANQLVASVHVYGQPLGSPYDSPSTWDGDMARVAQHYPIVMGEIGDSDCTHNFIDKLMPWADSHGISYVAWSWIVGNCSGEPSLITNYNGTPSNYGIGFRNHLLSLPH